MTAQRLLIGGREYDIACDDGQEAHLKMLARLLDQRIRGMGESLGRVDGQQLLILSSLMLTDELLDARRELDQMRQLGMYAQPSEKEKQIDMEAAIALTLNNIADRIDAIAGELERV